MVIGLVAGGRPRRLARQDGRAALRSGITRSWANTKGRELASELKDGVQPDTLS